MVELKQDLDLVLVNKRSAKSPIILVHTLAFKVHVFSQSEFVVSIMFSFLLCLRSVN